MLPSTAQNRTINAEKPPKKAAFQRKVVRVVRLERTTSSSQSWRATNCATPGYENMAILKNYHIIIHESLANFKRILAANAWI